MNFLKRVLATIVGIFVFLVLTVIFIGLTAYFINKSTREGPKVPENTVLQLHLDFPLQDNAGTVKYEDLPFLNEDNKDGLFDLVNAIDHAAHDDHIKGISIDRPTTNAGITQIKTLRKALEHFKESGKFVTAYADTYSQKEYYLSAMADSISVSPVGQIEFKGLATELLYLKDLQEKSGIKMDVVRMGKYKSAVEPFLDNDISEENKKQIASYLGSIWHSLRKDIGKNRNLDPKRLDTIADKLLARTPDRSRKVGLTDKTEYYSDYEKSLKHQLNLNKDDDLNQIKLVDYAENQLKENTNKHESNKIAVIYAQGEIIEGKGTVDKIGPKEINKAIKKAKDDAAVKAIVLRINSPGGSALASDLIWKQLKRAAHEKPLVVSMGDVAASGGYYMASAGDQIFAEPSTITGSIGVFGILPNVKGLADKIGVHAHHVSTNKNTITYTPFEDMTDSQEEFIREQISRTYDLFKSRVAEGRDIAIDSVQEIAQGRVWTGEQAIKNGLVDQAGGMDRALDYAADQADIKDYKTQEYPVFKVNLNQILRKYGIGLFSKEDLVKETMGKDLYNKWKTIKQKTDHEGIQVLFPFSTDIK